MKNMVVVLHVLWIFFAYDAVDAYSSHLCPSLILRNGRVKYLRGGRAVKFSCNKPYSLIGNSILDCYNGEWNGASPICAKKNCERFPKLAHGKITYYNDAAIAKANCDPDFTLIGSRYMYCDEAGWNDTSPACKANSLNQFGTCNYEPDGTQQCEWISKPMLFNWTIMSSNHHENEHMPLDSYPEHDHSLSPHTGGHFLYLETLFSPSKTSLHVLKTQNAAAKYISPLFPAIFDNITETYCLIFYLYMNGPHSGAVEVRIADQSAWRNNASLGNEWHKITIPLQIQPHPFRITIEGIAELGYFTNTAIDDLKIASEEECKEDIQNAKLPSDFEKSTEFHVLTTQAETEKVYHSTFDAENSQNITLAATLSTSNEPKIESTTTQRITTLFNLANDSANDLQKPHIESHTALAGNTDENSTKIEKTETSTHPNTPITEFNSVNQNIIKNATNTLAAESTTLKQDQEHISNDANQIAVSSSYNQDHDDGNDLNVHATINETLRVRQSEQSQPHTHIRQQQLFSNNFTVEPNDTKYEYNNQEKKERSDPKQEGNEGHFEGTGNDLETNDNHVESVERENDRKAVLIAKSLESKQSHEDGRLYWIILLIVMLAVLLILTIIIFSLVSKKYYYKYRNTHKDESSIRFFKQDNTLGSISRREDVLVLNYGPQNIS